MCSCDDLRIEHQAQAPFKVQTRLETTDIKRATHMFFVPKVMSMAPTCAYASLYVHDISHDYDVLAIACLGAISYQKVSS